MVKTTSSESNPKLLPHGSKASNNIHILVYVRLVLTDVNKAMLHINMKQTSLECPKVTYSAVLSAGRRSHYDETIIHEKYKNSLS